MDNQFKTPPRPPIPKEYRTIGKYEEPLISDAIATGLGIVLHIVFWCLILQGII